MGPDRWSLWNRAGAALLILCAGGPLAAAETEEPAAPDLTPSHAQVGTIDLKAPDGKQTKLNTFCLAPDGRVVTAWGGLKTEYVEEDGRLQPRTTRQPAMVRVYDADGKPLASWDIDITPQALNVGPDGRVYAAGYGQLVRLDADGTVLAKADAPHAAAVEENADKLREQLRESLARSAEQYKETLEAARERLATLEEKLGDKDESELKPVEKRRLKAARLQVENYERLVKEEGEPQPGQEEMMLLNKKAVRGIAVTDRDIFVSTPAVEGYGYDVWRMGLDFSEPERIVTGLSGCCNPMNLRFGPGGEVYTAESTLGRIKRFSADGELLGVVGSVKLVPGCKHVAIAVADKGDRVYMLDITRNQIIVMGRQERPAGDAPAEVSLSGDAGAEVEVTR